MAEDAPRSRSWIGNAGSSEKWSWITTEVAAKAVRIRPRTMRRYTEQDKLEAKPQGEVSRRKRFVSVGSLHALQYTRSTDEGILEIDCRMKYAESIVDAVREMAAQCGAAPAWWTDRTRR
jgi:DNA helicase TIP49 (TBP-interacting protein)